MSKLATGVSFKDSSIRTAATAGVLGQGEPEIPGSARVVGGLKADGSFQGCDETPTGVGPREICQGSVEGFA